MYDPTKQQRRGLDRWTNAADLDHLKNLKAVTIDDFFRSTVGEWEEIKEIPSGFKLIKSNGSKYYTNAAEDTVIRVSDHWGSNIGTSSWYLLGHAQKECVLWSKGTRIVMIKLTELKRVE